MCAKVTTLQTFNFNNHPPYHHLSSMMMALAHSLDCGDPFGREGNSSYCGLSSRLFSMVRELPAAAEAGSNGE